MTNNSGRLPSEDCRTPVALGPSRSPNASTERPTRDASVASATAATTKDSTALAWTKCNAPAPRAEITVIAMVMRSRRDNNGAVRIVVTRPPGVWGLGEFARNARPRAGKPPTVATHGFRRHQPNSVPLARAASR